MVLYAATACFILMVIDLAVTSAVSSYSGGALGLLNAGVTLMFVGIVCELFDLAKARKTTEIEIEDVIG
jgi:hypothetical protein